MTQVWVPVGNALNPDPIDAYPAAVDEHVQTVPAHTWVIDHTLGRDPVAIQVLVDGIEVGEGWSTSFTVPGEQVMLGFDVAISGIARLM